MHLPEPVQGKTAEPTEDQEMKMIKTPKYFKAKKPK